MFFTNQKFDGTFEVLSYFFENQQKLIWVIRQMFYEPKIRWNFEVLLYFSKTTKVDMSTIIDKVLFNFLKLTKLISVIRKTNKVDTNQKKFDGTLKFWRIFRNRQKLIWDTNQKFEAKNWWNFEVLTYFYGQWNATSLSAHIPIQNWSLYPCGCQYRSISKSTLELWVLTYFSKSPSCW